MLPDQITKLAGNGFAYSFKPNDNGTIGVDYFQNGQPINNSQWGGNISASELEKAASRNYRSYDDYLLDNGGVTSDNREDPQIGPTAISRTSDNREDPAPTDTPITPGFNYDDEAAYYDDQIANINRLLGRLDLQTAKGRQNIDSQFSTQNTDLSNRQTRDMNMYAAKGVENAQDKQSGIEGVDNYANTSYNSLMRLLGGAGAGNSSVARTVVPTMVSNSAGTRRRSIFDIFGKNQANIDTAKTDAENEYKDAFGDLNKWKEEQNYNLDTNYNTEAAGMLDKRKGLETNRARLSDSNFLQSLYDSGQANTGYRAARTAGSGTQAEIDAKMARLDSLFGSFNPSYSPRTINNQTPELSKYTMDKGSISTDGTTPGESLPYLPMLRKRKELA